MATTSVLEPPKQRHVFARRFLELVIPPKIKQPSPSFHDTQTLAMFFYTELSEISEVLSDSLYLSGCGPVTSDNVESLGITAIVCALSEAEERRMMGDRHCPNRLRRCTFVWSTLIPVISQPISTLLLNLSMTRYAQVVAY